VAKFLSDKLGYHLSWRKARSHAKMLAI